MTTRIKKEEYGTQNRKNAEGLSFVNDKLMITFNARNKLLEGIIRGIYTNSTPGFFFF